MLQNKVLKDANLLWQYHCKIDNISKVDYPRLIIGLGSYDLRVAEYCAQLYIDGLGQCILFTGKSGNWTTGKFTKSEAEIFADIAIDNGVPPDKILIEPEATNIGENIKFSRKCMENSTIQYQEIILVTKPNTTRRAFATFKAQWSDMPVLLSAPNYSLDNPAHGFTTNDLIHELVGDLERIILYPSKGFQISQEIPEDVLEVYNSLRKSGFTNHCQAMS